MPDDILFVEERGLSLRQTKSSSRSLVSCNEPSLKMCGIRNSNPEMRYIARVALE